MKKDKSFLISVLIVFLVILGVWWWWKSGVTKWPIYENARYGFSLNYPKGWVLGEEETDHSGRMIYDQLEDGEVDCYAYGFTNALLGESGDPQTLAEFVGWLIEDQREPGEGLYTHLLERKDITWDKQPAVWFLMEQDMNIRESVYTLNEEEGRGFFCVYKDMEVRDKYKNIFDKMVASWHLGMGGEQVSFGGEKCVDLLAGLEMSTPLKDLQQFFDTGYTEVTLIAHDNWDVARLPDEVIFRENQGYSCYPMPYEFSETNGGDDEVLAEPEVAKVEWSCELSFSDYKYLEFSDEIGKNSLEKQDYLCEQLGCQGGDEVVWLCGK